MNGTQTVSREFQEIDSVVAKHKGHHGELLSILEETQLLNESKFLSEEALNHVALRTGIPFPASIMLSLSIRSLISNPRGSTPYRLQGHCVSYQGIKSIA